jgi:hypothetical protein
MRVRRWGKKLLPVLLVMREFSADNPSQGLAIPLRIACKNALDLSAPRAAVDGGLRLIPAGETACQYPDMPARVAHDGIMIHSDGRRWMLRASGVTSLRPAKPMRGEQA